MNIEYTLTPDELSDAVDNTIRVFDEYRLIKKKNRDGTQDILDTRRMGTFSYYISETPEGSRLTLEAKAPKPLTAEERTGHEEIFLKNLFKIIDKEIAITPEIANRSLYKSRRMSIGFWSIFWIFLILVLVVKTIHGCMKHSL